MRRLLIILFPFLLSGIVIYNEVNYLLISAVISALFLIIVIKKYYSLALFCTIFVLIGMLIAFMHTMLFENRYKNITEMRSFQGYVIESYDNSYVIKNYEQGYKIVATSFEKINAIPGDYIHFYGKVKEKPEYKKNMLNSRGIDAYVSINSGNIKKEKRSSIRMIPVKVKYEISSALLSINSKGGNFISGLVSGYSKEMEFEDRKNFEDLGLSHILAISGFNIGIVYYFTSMITRNVAARLRYMIVIFVCFIYTLIGGFEPSIFRAFIMIIVATLAKLLNRPYDVVNGITLTAIIMLCINSFYIYNLGFILSFAGTYGIILFNNDIKDKIPDKLRLIRDETAVSLAAFIPTLPFILWFRGFISLISIPLNILIAPIIGLLTIISFICSLLYVIIKLKIILYPAVFIGLLFVETMNFFAKFNLAMYIGKPPIIFIMLYFSFIALNFEYIKIKVYRKTKILIKMTVFILMIATLMFSENSNLKIHVLNVGQGDSILIETPHGQTILVDTGPGFGDYIAVRDKVIPYIKRLGYNKLDMAFITHMHNDHAGGLDYLVTNFNVNKILTYDLYVKDNLRSITLAKGDEVRLDGIIINILYPEQNMQVTDDINEIGLIFDLNYKDFSMLLTADAGMEEMNKISGIYDIFKVPHHGSIYSFSEGMLNSSSIGTAIISVGKNNFGHPSKKVIEEFEKRGIKVYRTDLDGDIRVITNGRKYKID